MNVITHREVLVDGCRYHVSIRYYDEEREHVTADWWRETDGKRDTLGYGLGDCYSVESDAQQEIRKRHRAERLKQIASNAGERL